CYTVRGEYSGSLARVLSGVAWGLGLGVAGCVLAPSRGVGPGGGGAGAAGGGAATGRAGAGAGGPPGRATRPARRGARAGRRAAAPGRPRPARAPRAGAHATGRRTANARSGVWVSRVSDTGRQTLAAGRAARGEALAPNQVSDSRRVSDTGLFLRGGRAACGG